MTVNTKPYRSNAPSHSPWDVIMERTWILHVGYWLFFVLFFGLFWGSVHGNYQIMLLSEGVLLPTKLAAVYFFLYVLIPKYLLKQKYSAFGLLAISCLILIGTTQRLIAFHYLHPWKSFDSSLSPINVYEIMHQILNISTAMFIPIAVNLLSIWTNKKLEAKDLEKQQIETELKFLRNQLQPHFLFNTLNNLYGLILKKSDRAKEVVLKLSELMRYTLYDTNVDKVDLSQEINHMTNYIELEKIRYGKRIDVGFNLYGDHSSLKVAPMLMLHFVENSFKHSLTSSEETGWISIEISTSKHTCTLKVENSKPGHTLQNNDVTHLVSGIGLENVRRQLDLIYTDRYQLKIEDLEDTYMIILKLDLSD